MRHNFLIHSLIYLAFSHVVCSFTVNPRTLTKNVDATNRRLSIQSTSLFLSTPDVAITAAASLDPGSKFYQLEEMEDKDACTTELFLLNDGSIQVSETNGPPPAKSSGQWRLESNNDGGGVFEMTIVRTYGTGNQNTDLGEFTFNVERNFIGNVSIVGGLVSVTGAISMKNDFAPGDIEVGYFSMIDTTEAKLNEGESPSPLKGATRTS